jgi:hypothetical protein
VRWPFGMCSTHVRKRIIIIIKTPPVCCIFTLQMVGIVFWYRERRAPDELSRKKEQTKGRKRKYSGIGNKRLKVTCAWMRADPDLQPTRSSNEKITKTKKTPNKSPKFHSRPHPHAPFMTGGRPRPIM